MYEHAWSLRNTQCACFLFEKFLRNVHAWYLSVLGIWERCSVHACYLNNTLWVCLALEHTWYLSTLLIWACLVFKHAWCLSILYQRWPRGAVDQYVSFCLRRALGRHQNIVSLKFFRWHLYVSLRLHGIHHVTDHGLKTWDAASLAAVWCSFPG